MPCFVSLLYDRWPALCGVVGRFLATEEPFFVVQWLYEVRQQFGAVTDHHAVPLYTSSTSREVFARETQVHIKAACSRSVFVRAESR